MKKILLSGSNGFIGSNLINVLINSGYHVEGIIKKKGNYSYPTHLLDLKNLQSFNKIKSKFDCIIHLAGETDEKNFDDMFCNNVIATKNFLQFAIRKKIPKFIFISGHNVYSQFLKLPISENSDTLPDSNYGITKLLSEQLVKYYYKKYSLNSIILRISFTYGNNQKKEKMLSKLIYSYKNSKNITIHKYRNGYQKMDLIHVQDVCNAILRSLKSTKSFGIYNIASGKPCTIKDVIKILQQSHKSNSKIKIKHINKKTNHFFYDNELSFKELKFRPKISLEQGIKSLL